MSKTIVMLLGKNHSSSAIYNGLKSQYNIKHIILEDSKSKNEFIKRRIKKLGLIKVMGQALFQKLVVPFLNKESKERIDAIIKNNHLEFTEFEKEKLIMVPSANSKNFEYYTYLQLAKGIDLMKLAVDDLINNKQHVVTNGLGSKL